MDIIEPRYLTLDGLFQKRLFSIPNYQRTYSWGKKQCGQLFSDIDKIALVKNSGKDKHHFMSTIVCRKKENNIRIGTDEYESLDIVDGQQRITTLIILLKAISLNLNEKNPAEKKEKGNLEELFSKEEGYPLLLQSNHDTRKVFENYLKNGVKPFKKDIQTFTDENLNNAFKESESFVKKWIGKTETDKNKNNFLVELLNIIKNRLGFIFYTLRDQGSVYRIFEVLNSRGLEVDVLDKLKSMLMGFVYENFSEDTLKIKQEELHNDWVNIYRDIGRSNIKGEEIVKFSASLLTDNIGRRPINAEDSLRNLMDLCRADKEYVTVVNDKIRKVTEALKEIYEDKKKKAVTEIAHARLAAVAIKLSGYNDDEKSKLLEQWERTSFRIFGLYNCDSRTGVGDYMDFVRIVTEENINFKKAFDALISIGKKYDISKIDECFFERNCYNGWRDNLKYFFFKYEKHLCKKNKSKTSNDWEVVWSEPIEESVEHIFPQTLNNQWKGKSGRGKKYEAYVHRLGNLVLLTPGANSQCSNNSFLDKIEVYKKQNLSIAREISEYSNSSRYLRIFFHAI
jgi:uncharacterized protein with ParB-like and HNH nuclease domain